MQYFKSFSSIFALALLAGCGGGGSGGGLGSTPTPTSADPVSRNSSLVNLTQNDEFAASIYGTNVTLSKSTGGVTSIGNGGGVTNTIVRYDAGTKGYSIAALPVSPGTTPSFNDSHKSLADSNNVLTIYKKQNGTRSEQFILFNPGSNNSNLALTYTSYGAWLVIDDNSNSLNTTISYFAFGTRTSSADMPKSGSATYNTIMDGSFADSAGVYVVTGPSSFSADFGAGTVAFSAAPTGVNVLNGSTKSLGSFNGTGAIESATARFNTSGTASSNGYNFGFFGHFYGPAAAEIGGAFTITGNGGTGVGAIVGKKN